MPNIIRRLLEGNENKWLWYGGTFLGSAIPMICRLIATMGTNGSKFDLKDLLFMGLAINLSNLNLIGSRQFQYKLPIAIISGIFIFIIGFVLGRLMNNESTSRSVIGSPLTIFSVIFVSLSIIVSYEANRYVFAVVN